MFYSDMTEIKMFKESDKVFTFFTFCISFEFIQSRFYLDKIALTIINFNEFKVIKSNNTVKESSVLVRNK